MDRRLRLFSIALCAAFAQAGAGNADSRDWVLCRNVAQVPVFRELPPTPGLRHDAATSVEADAFDVSEQERTVLTGDVELWRADQWLGAEYLMYEHATRAYSARGNVRYQDAGMRFTAARIDGDMDADEHHLEDVNYQIASQSGSGVARAVELRGPLGAMRDATYSTCDADRRSWELRARRIDIDNDRGEGTARGATLYLGRMPVLHTPWASFPIDDRRRSGFLYPTVGHDSRTGLDLRIPYYLNLAPNYDATLSTRIIGRRGVMAGGELRYLTQRHFGHVDATWMPDDRLADRSRGSLWLLHYTRLNRHWQARARVWRVSDREYLEDFGEDSYMAAISQIASTGGLYGRGAFWSGSVVATGFQLTDPLLTDSNLRYFELPRMAFRYDRPLLDWLVAGLRSELVAFEHPVRIEGRRVDLKPYLMLPFEGNAWFARPQLAYRYTAYDLDRASDTAPTRALPIASFDTGMFFERPARVLGRDFLQTLEPRLFYLRVPYREQSNLPVFDTRELTFGYAQLFRDNRYSGADRQSDADQATLAVTTRLLDPGSGREWLNASAGQIRYFREPRVTLPGRAPVQGSGSDYVAEVELLLDDRWSLRTTQVYSPELSSRSLSVVRGQYRFGDRGVANLAYRYRRDLLEHVDASVVYPLSPSWRLVSRWNYSLDDRSTIEAVGGFEWEGCCVAVRVLGRHYIRNREGEKNNAIYFELELKGLGSFGRRTEDLLGRGILDYQR